MDSDVAMVPAGDSTSLPGPSSSSKKPKRLEIKKWNAVALWAWEITSWIYVLNVKLIRLALPAKSVLLLGVAGEEPNPCWWKGPREVFKSVPWNLKCAKKACSQ
ncbi:uncharacterized protein LOC110897767 isoform X2 [Helianthus annuus]|uniref:uncharacterized protein LOC110897767 isoform X2 n=1 Tax=Helianthus annuus TaxID=4232 RepID=UPI001652C8A4|nr:uncharacterized protein LOC110897767 isoform X2 [Helianthus annuus]